MMNNVYKIKVSFYDKFGKAYSYFKRDSNLNDLEFCNLLEAKNYFRKKLLNKYEIRLFKFRFNLECKNPSDFDYQEGYFIFEIIKLKNKEKDIVYKFILD